MFCSAGSQSCECKWAHRWRASPCKHPTGSSPSYLLDECHWRLSFCPLWHSVYSPSIYLLNIPRYSSFICEKYALWWCVLHFLVLKLHGRYDSGSCKRQRCCMDMNDNGNIYTNLSCIYTFDALSWTALWSYQGNLEKTQRRAAQETNKRNIIHTKRK